MKQEPTEAEQTAVGIPAVHGWEEVNGMVSTYVVA